MVSSTFIQLLMNKTGWQNGQFNNRIKILNSSVVQPLSNASIH